MDTITSIGYNEIVMESCKIIIIEDDDLQRKLLKEILSAEGYQVFASPTAEGGLKIISQENPDIVITDVRLPGMNGIKLLERVKREFPETEVIITTAFSNVEDAVYSLKHGAFHYLVKPYQPEALLNLVEKACELSKLRKVRTTPEGVIFASRQMEEILKMAENYAKVDAPILILGESGVGKEVIASFIHKKSGRKGKFVPINCAAIPEELFESELFGHEKGAFTGAETRRKGLIEEADGGTIFLDEVGELPLQVQAKLLRFLQEGEIKSVGSNEIKKVDARVIAATNRDLEEEVKNRKFREDLFYRLNVLTLHIPPLRERREDIIPLTGYFLKKYSEKYGKEVSITPEALEKLQQLPFPGNVRELENLIHKLVISVPGKIDREDIPDSENRAIFPLDFTKPLPEQIAEYEKRMIEEALKRTGYVQTKAAELLGIDEKSLRYKRKKYGI